LTESLVTRNLNGEWPLESPDREEQISERISDGDETKH